jgi:CBS domain-containing protein
VPLDGRVDSVMTSGVVVLDVDADVRSAIAMFAGHPFRRAPVVEGTKWSGWSPLTTSSSL